MNKQEIPKEITDAFDKAGKSYAESKATTNAGRFLRFLARIIPPSTLFKIIAAQKK